MPDTVFDPLDERWWRGGTTLAWWDSALASPPAWLPDKETAESFLTRNHDRLLRALGLIHSHRTVETRQLHLLDAKLPARGDATLYLSMAAVGLVDMGWPVSVDGRASVGPRHAPFTALRLPAHRALTVKELLAFGLNPVEIRALGPEPWRGIRQYDRHNLICAALAIQARRTGWLTAGEAWGRFDLMTGDPLAGRGGPDLELFGSRLVCIELTASTNLQLESKLRKWDRMLAYPRMEHVDVVWLSAGRGDNTQILNRLAALTVDRPRQHAADTRDWLDGRLECADGFTPTPPTVTPDPSGWMRGAMTMIGERLGFPYAGQWRLPARLEGRWIG